MGKHLVHCQNCSCKCECEKCKKFEAGMKILRHGRCCPGEGRPSIAETLLPALQALGLNPEEFAGGGGVTWSNGRFVAKVACVDDRALRYKVTGLFWKEEIEAGTYDPEKW